MLKTIDHGAVRELELDNPPVNALRPQMLEQLATAVRGAPGDGVRALVISGRPGMFSAGLDVPYMLTLDRAGVCRGFEALFAAMRTLAASPVPVAAAITGHSPAGGAVLALFCDYRVMAEGEFRIGLNEVQVGLPIPPPIVGAIRRLVGARVAERLCVEGRMITAHEAMQAGLVDEARPAEQVRDAAIAWCARVSELPAGAMGATRAQCRADLPALFPEPDAESGERFADVWFSDETQTAMRALVARLGK